MPAPRFDFPRTHRLLTGRDYQRVFGEAFKSSDHFLTVLAKSNGREGARLGLAISKRNVRHAVDRNRVKRIARESFRIRWTDLGNFDYVVLARPAAANADTTTLSRSLRRHWDQLVRQCSSFSSPSSSSTAI
ncbi:MAG TPA: ribonuclease P protein component [Methylococcaceae bacterium]|nr:ribonuclease P protein component [Methylococcaceae bacterium]